MALTGLRTFDSKEKFQKSGFLSVPDEFLANFHPGKPAPEPIVLERLLANLNTSPRDNVHCVVSAIHVLVNTIIHEHVRLKKTESEMAGEGISGGRCQLSKESDNSLYWYCGAAVCRIKLRKETS